MGRWSQETKVGFFLLLGIAIVIALVFKSGSFTLKRKETVKIKAVFEYVSSGLVPNAPVQMAGVKIGRVSEVLLMDGGRVTVALEVERNRIRVDDEARIETMGLLGDKYISIAPGSLEEEFAGDGENIKGRAPVSLEHMVRLASKISEDLSEIISTFNELLGTEETQDAVKETILNTRDVSLRARAFVGELSEVLSENRSDLREGVANMKEASERLKVDIDEGLKDINHLIRDMDGIVAENRKDTRKIVENLLSMSETLKLFTDRLEDDGVRGVWRGLKRKEKAEWPWDETDEP